MIKRIIVFTIIVLTMVRCHDSKKEESKTINTDNKELKKEIESKANKISVVKPEDCGMDFNAFFVKFSKDSIFQRSRVKYPLKMIYFDAYGSDQTTPIEEYIKLQDYQFFDFSLDNEAKNREVNAYTIKIEKKENDTYLYRQLGIDNGIMVEFKFIKDNGCWLLVSLKDEST